MNRDKLNSISVDENRYLERGILLFEEEIYTPPYRYAALSLAVTSGDELISYCIDCALKLATNVDVLILRNAECPIRWTEDTAGESIPAEFKSKRTVRVRMVDDEVAVQTYFQREHHLELVLTDRFFFSQFDDWNKRRKEFGLLGYDVLCQALDGGAFPATSLRAFRQASLGGTFNALHEGHREYLRSALRLADKSHILISDDMYAKDRKDYVPDSFDTRRMRLRRYVSEKLQCGDRVVTAKLSSVEDIEKYVRTCVQLDLVITERTYFDWFDGWNALRGKDGLVRYDILCRERTIIHGTDLSSSMFTEQEFSVKNDRLFEM